jgi:hypothetical protein
VLGMARVVCFSRKNTVVDGDGWFREVNVYLETEFWKEGVLYISIESS